VCSVWTNNNLSDVTASNIVHKIPEGVVTIGSWPMGTDFTSNYPVNYYFRRSLTQTIYHEEEMIQQGIIQNLTWRFSSSAIQPPTENIPVQIYLHTTEKSVFSGATVDDFIPLTDAVLVYDAPLHVAIPGGNFNLFVPFSTPYAYNGGNLVVTVVKNWSASYGTANVFHITSTPEQNRSWWTRTTNGPDFDAFEPVIGDSSGIAASVPNTMFQFDISNTGHLSGVVTSGNPPLPLEGVEIRLTDTTRRAFTDEQGHYLFTYLPEGNQSFTATKQGYFPFSFEQNITDLQTTQFDFTLVQMPTVVVSGKVISNDAPQGLVDAIVILDGLGYYETTTDNNGEFNFENVYSSFTYSLKITKRYYLPYQDDFLEIGTDDIVYPNVMLYERANSPENVLATIEGNNVRITWEEFPGYDIWISHGSGNNIVGALGIEYGDPVSYTAVQRFDAEQLIALGVADGTLSKIAFWENDTPDGIGFGDGTFTLKVYSGGSGTPLMPGTEIHSQPVNPYDVIWNNWTEIDLIPAINFPINNEIWFGVFFEGEGYVMGLGNGPAVNNYGNIVLFNSIWQTLPLEFQNFMIKGLVTGAE